MSKQRVFYGVYDGQVCNINDPEKRGRIQCVIPEVTGDSPSAWCEPCVPVAYDDDGDFFLPKLKEFVWILFEQGDPDRPVYFGGWWSEKRTPLGDDYFERIDERIISYKDVLLKMIEGKLEISVDSEDDPEIVVEHGSVTIKGTPSSSVTGVKGNKESSYRSGNVNLTPENIGALNETHSEIIANVATYGHVKLSDSITSSNLDADSGVAATPKAVDEVRQIAITGTDKHYVFTQEVASNVWNITHNLNKFPSVTIVDSGGSVVEGDITYIDNNSLTVTFVGGFTGKAYLN